MNNEQVNKQQHRMNKHSLNIRLNNKSGNRPRIREQELRAHMALVTRSEEPRAHMVRGRKSQELIWTRSEEPRAKSSFGTCEKVRT